MYVSPLCLFPQSLSLPSVPLSLSSQSTSRSLVCYPSVSLPLFLSLSLSLLNLSPFCHSTISLSPSLHNLSSPPSVSTLSLQSLSNLCLSSLSLSVSVYPLRLSVSLPLSSLFLQCLLFFFFLPICLSPES
ncbi:hypothetical protein NQD34_009101 [Periophthalmus magnuspinnatus]|nr:hypothetical protein NQD34_009101 [Periophthalmus magnuspinnatus]